MHSCCTALIDQQLFPLNSARGANDLPDEQMAPIQRKTAAAEVQDGQSPDPTAIHTPQPHSKSPSKPSQTTVTLLVLVTAAACLLILYNQEVITPNEWPQSAHIHQVTSVSSEAAFQAALDNAAQSPLVVIFYSPQCIACKRARKPFFQLVDALHTRVSFFAVPLGEPINHHYIADFQLKHVPSIFFIRGPEHNQRVHYTGKRNYAHMHAFISDNLNS
ncbi:hypothetical protein BWQ96_07472 [Gracilariopsis chorda]|uniref:Thioredoxin domain-containing protein n=1 Tax=Gracilariopsis chorda TaxID=448386 RepID=A0A2V3IL53_9FLOR|nr:hypothetical protein BWQ96_07472 [Gracilariopsis chorda]|eukprot:PXF42821.1 hypothetical protein BWQ96_07472 [Gracilariopsis chorda]